MFTSLANVLVLILTGAATGVLGAILGTGGGVFLVPVLVLGFDVPIHYAVATSIVTVIATSSAVASVNVERGTANMRLGMTLEIGTCSGAILGGLTAGWLSAHVLEAIFGLLLLPTALLMWRGRVAPSPSNGRFRTRPIARRAGQGEERSETSFAVGPRRTGRRLLRSERGPHRGLSGSPGGGGVRHFHSCRRASRGCWGSAAGFSKCPP